MLKSCAWMDLQHDPLNHEIHWGEAWSDVNEAGRSCRRRLCKELHEVCKYCTKHAGVENCHS